MRRVVLVLADGLRPDAVTAGGMPSLYALGRQYARAVNARTVRPSATVAALASLATGVCPESHGLVKPGLEFLTRLGSLRPVGKELSRHGLSTTVVAGAMNRAARTVAWALAAAAGAKTLIAEGETARETAEAAHTLENRRSSLTMVYLPDCDRAGHAHGWMSEPYLAAASDVDAAIGSLAQSTRDALVIVLADHGGGGVQPTEHDEPHPLNDAIPLVLAGTGVRRRTVIADATSLLDVPPTILLALGLPIPESYEGRVIREAFAPALPVAAMAV